MSQSLGPVDQGNWRTTGQDVQAGSQKELPCLAMDGRINTTYAAPSPVQWTNAVWRMAGQAALGHPALLGTLYSGYQAPLGYLVQEALLPGEHYTRNSSNTLCVFGKQSFLCLCPSRTWAPEHGLQGTSLAPIRRPFSGFLPSTALAHP